MSRNFFLVFGAVILFLLRLIAELWLGEEHTKALSAHLGLSDLEACVVEEVDVRRDKIKYIVNWQDWRVMVNAPRYPMFEYGDCLKFLGRLELPSKIEDFDYPSYLARFRIYGIFNAQSVEFLERKKLSFLSILFSLKNEFSQRVNSLYSEPYASFMLGLLLGSRKGMSEKILADFQETGLTHIVAVSGYNVSLIVIAVFWFCGLFALGRRAKVMLAIFFVFIFVIFVGASAAVVRAGVMGTIALLAVYYGRLYVTGRALLLSAFFIALFNPLIVVSDAGFHLSFLATVGIVYIYPFLERKFHYLPQLFAFKESFLMTFSAQIAVSPVLFLNFGEISWISPVVNIFVLPLLPLAMLLGFLSLLASFFSLWLAEIIAFLAYLDLRLILWIVEIFA